MTRRPITPVAKRPRGRPKGTGINDAGRLASIHAMLSADRALKPTTAIKRAGVTDPSDVRRLREKLRGEAGAKPRLPAAALAASRSETVTAELPVNQSAPIKQPPPQSEPEPEQPVSSGKHPPLAAETEKRTREALLLAAYLEAMIKSPPQTAPPDALDKPRQEPRPEPPQPLPEPPQQHSQPPPRPQPTEAQQPSQTPFSFPGMPPFLQPFRQPPPAPTPGTSQAQQLEGMKLAVEAMTTMTKLQLHITENAMAYSPLAMMLQGQAMVGQMLLASFTGQLDAMKPKKPDGSKS